MYIKIIINCPVNITGESGKGKLWPNASQYP